MNGLLGPEEQKRLVDGLLGEARTLRQSTEEQLVKLFGTKYGGSALVDALNSCTYTVKTFFLRDGYTRIQGLFDGVSSAVERALKK